MKKPKTPKARVYIVPTRYGLLYAIMVVLFLLVGTWYENNTLLISTALLVTFGLVCMHQTNANVAHVEIEKLEPESGFSGQNVSWKIQLKNHAPLMALSVNIRDAVIDVPSGEIFIENIPVILRKRGHVQMDRLKISSTYPFGLFYAWKYWKGYAQYYVYPRLNTEVLIPPHRRSERSILDGREDFLGHRDYIPGDSAHHIDWKVQARRQKLMVKLFDTHQPEEVILDWNDFSASSDEERLSQMATAVHECFKLQKSFRLKIPSVDYPAQSGREHYEKCLRALAVFGKEDQSYEKAA